MTPEELVDAAISVAEEGVLRREMPIGAVVEMGGEIIASTHTQDQARQRHLVVMSSQVVQPGDRRGLADGGVGPMMVVIV
ncbi:hypothetical protein [Actinoplanes sp. NPDC020271]|uniref:hypothetical protein n=1 Tax=Actinoplanes sp. NPDC020271 TaxID=3363896 RepID=UPI0037A57EA4